MGERPEPARQLAPLDHAARSRTACAGSAPTTSTCTRCTGPTRRPTSTRRSARSTDLVHQGKVRVPRLARRSRPSCIVEAQWVAERRGRERFRVRAAAVLDLRARDRARRAADVRALRHGRDPVEPARRRLAHRASTAEGERRRRRSGRAAAHAGRASTSTSPTNQRKLDARRGARRSWPTTPGMTLTHLALAFVLEHPAVTSAIIGPRTMEQLDGPRSPAPTCGSTPTCSTASTRSCRRARTSTGRRRLDAAGARARRRAAAARPDASAGVTRRGSGARAPDTAR